MCRDSPRGFTTDYDTVRDGGDWCGSRGAVNSLEFARFRSWRCDRQTINADPLIVELSCGRIIAQRYKPGWHVIGAALRSTNGRIFTGVHLEAYVGRVAICAEAVALGRAATEAGDTDIDTIVAVGHSGAIESEAATKVVAPWWDVAGDDCRLQPTPW